MKILKNKYINYNKNHKNNFCLNGTVHKISLNFVLNKTKNKF